MATQVNRSDATTYFQLFYLDALSDTARRSVTLEHAQAQAYAWGMEDSGNGRSDAYDFGIAYGIVAAEYALERRTFRPNIRDSYKRWCANEDISGN